jgi:hypothetical protein
MAATVAAAASSTWMNGNRPLPPPTIGSLRERIISACWPSRW